MSIGPQKFCAYAGLVANIPPVPAARTAANAIAAILCCSWLVNIKKPIFLINKLFMQ